MTNEAKNATSAQSATIPRGSRWSRSFRTGALGMCAEILFTCGLILIGFLISLLSGW